MSLPTLKLTAAPPGRDVTARMALRHTKGLTGIDEMAEFESVTGSTMTGRVLAATQVGQYAAVVIQVGGRSFYTGSTTFTVEKRGSPRRRFPRSMILSCPACGETDRLEGSPDAMSDNISIVCGACELVWTRDPSPTCAKCASKDMFAAVAAIIEKGRGTQLSVVGSRIVSLCEVCDAETIDHYLRTRPNPLMPHDLPNADGDAGAAG